MYTPGSLSKKVEGDEAIISTDDGTQIFTVRAGKGKKTVVLAHGYGFTMDEWNIVAPLLTASGYRVILFDQRGHGRSDIGRDGISSAAMAADCRAVFNEPLRQAPLNPSFQQPSMLPFPDRSGEKGQITGH